MPENAEQLMRSRFTAYRRHDIKYLSATWWPDYCPFDTQQPSASPSEQWISLDVTGSGVLQFTNGRFDVCSKASSFKQGNGQKESLARESLARESLARESLARESLARESLPRLPEFLQQMGERCEWQWVRFEALGYQQDDHQFFRLTEFSRFVRMKAPLNIPNDIECPVWLADEEMQNQSANDQWCHRWLYVDGIADWSDIAVTRNSPCPCGSGKKWKRCHGSNA